MSLKLISFKIEHLGLMKLRPRDAEQLELFKTIYQGNEERFRAWTIIDENAIPVAACGMTMPWPSVASVFMAFSQMVEDDAEIARQTFWTIKGFIKQIFQDYHLHRMEADTPDDCDGQVRWMKLLGFDLEGVMQKYDPQGRDYLRFAKVI